MKIAKIWQLKKIEFAQKANSFIYFLSHAFVLKRFFHEDLVSEYDSKEGVALTLMSLNFLFRIGRKVLYTTLIYQMLSHDQISFGVIFLLLTIAGTAIKDIIKFDERDYENVILLRVNTTDYGHLVLAEYLITEGVLFLLGFTIARNIAGINYLQSLLIIPAYLGIHLFGEMLELKSIEKNGFLINKNNKIKNIITIILLLVPLALVAALAYFQPDIPLIVEILMIAGGIAAGAVAGLYLFKKPNYGRIFRYNLSLDTIRNSEMVITDGRTEINVNEMNEKLNNDAIKSSRKGYDFIFDAFRQRYRKNFIRDWVIEMVITVIVTVIGCAVPFLAETWIDLTGADEIVLNLILRRLLIVSYPIYFFSTTSKKFVMSCFLQIDSKLVNYSFFRNKNAVRKNYLLRLLEAIKITLVPTVILAFGVLLIYVFNTPVYSLSEMAVIFLLPLILGTFFAVFHISAYYFFHPYDSKGRVVNKVYAVVDYLVYLFSYLCIDINIELTLELTAMIAVTLALFSIIMYVIVLNYAPKHFRVR